VLPRIRYTGGGPTGAVEHTTACPRQTGVGQKTVAGVLLMGVVRALVVIILIAVAASPLVSGKLGLSADVPSVYADFSSVSVQQKHPERDKEKKDQNRDSDEDEKGNREKTSEEKKAEKDNLEEDDDAPRNVTNALSEDNFAIEGWVIALNCAAEPKEITINTVDGPAVLYQGRRDTENRIDRLYCGDLVVGDYIFVHEAQKNNEQSYIADYISCQQEREEGPDNVNENSDDVDPNCTHIWNR
jgi:hypothetical protein